MKRVLCLAAVLCVVTCSLMALPEVVKVHVRVILVDNDLNQKAVPFFVVSFKGGAKAVEVKTGLDGSAETQLAPGRYTVTTLKPAELGGKRFRWDVRVTLSGSEQNVDLTNDNATVEEISNPAAVSSATASGGGDLTEQFKRLKNSVVTVKSESGHGTGFFVDNKGLILTNQHVVSDSEYLAVQFDRDHKVRATLLAADPEKDVALLWVNMASFSGATPAPLYSGRARVEEGERVFTIGSPLTLDKIITTGIVSKVEAHTIMSDIRISPGNSGGPLFNGAGQVIGLTTFGTHGGAGVSGVVRIEEALPLLEQNRGKAQGTPPPGALLPVEPLTQYPVEGLKDALKGEKFDPRPYYLAAGDFYIALSTPPFDYREQEERRLQAERAAKKRNKKQQDADDTADDSAPKQWEEEAGVHPAVFAIFVMPKVKEGFGSTLGRSFNAYAAAKLKFKTDFAKMKLYCGGKEVQPIDPGRVPVTVSERTRAIKMEDSTYKGLYTYEPDAVRPDCGEVKLEIYSSKDIQPVIKILDEKSVQHIWADFDAFRRAEQEAGATKGTRKN